MKKVFIVFLLIIGLFSISKINVNAETIKRYDDKKERIEYLEDKGEFASCDGIITEEGLEIIREILNWIRIIAPILLILLVAIDLGSAVLSSDNDSISKSVKKIVPRMIGTALLFFVPTLVRAILNVGGIRDALVIPDDPLCHTMAAKETINYDYI